MRSLQKRVLCASERPRNEEICLIPGTALPLFTGDKAAAGRSRCRCRFSCSAPQENHSILFASHETYKTWSPCCKVLAAKELRHRSREEQQSFCVLVEEKLHHLRTASAASIIVVQYLIRPSVRHVTRYSTPIVKSWTGTPSQIRPRYHDKGIGRQMTKSPISFTRLSEIGPSFSSEEAEHCSNVKKSSACPIVMSRSSTFLLRLK